MEKRKKILVIGGAGFIGSHFVDHFIQNEQVVTVFDNLSSGELSWLNGHSCDMNL